MSEDNITATMKWHLIEISGRMNNYILSELKILNISMNGYTKQRSKQVNSTGWWYTNTRDVYTYNIYTWVLIKTGDTNVNNKYTKCNIWRKSIFPCLWWHVVFPIHNIKNIIKSTLDKRRKSCIDSIQQLQIVVTQNISRTKQRQWSVNYQSSDGVVLLC